MTSYILIFLLVVLFIYTTLQKWYPKKYKLFFIIVNLAIFLFLILSALNYKILKNSIKLTRKTIVFSYDISSSMDYDIDKMKELVKSNYQNLNIEFIPFSNKMFGLYKSTESLIFQSINEIAEYINIKYTDEEIASLIIITDGNETKDIKLMKKNLDIKFSFPINIIYYNQNKLSNFDRQISFSNYPKFISRFNKDKVAFSVSTIGENLKSIVVQLKVDGKVYASTSCDIYKNYGEGVFDISIDKLGDHLVEISIPRDSREQNITNNVDYGIIEGVLDEYRVLHISGHPSTDTAFVRRALQNIPGLDLISFFILRTSKQLSLVNENELSLIPFPTDELFNKELNNFDLIIANDFNFNEYLSPLYLSNIKKYVESGGKILIFGGPDSFNNEIKNSMFSLFNNTNFVKQIVPVTYTNSNNYKDIDFKISHNEMSKLLGFNKFSDKIILKGINKVQLNSDALNILETNLSFPLVASSFYKKGKVVSVLSDAFWKLSYLGDLSVNNLISFFVNYLMDINNKIVYKEGKSLKFVERCTDNNISANLSIFDINNNQVLTKNILCDESIDVSNFSKNKVMVDIKYANKLVSKYSFYIYNEPEGDEFSSVPFAKIFLSNLAKNNDGIFIETNKISDINKINFNKYSVKTKSDLILVDIFRIKYLLLILLFLLVFSYYLKSRYMS